MNNRAFPPAAGHVPPGAIGHNRGVIKRNYAFMPPEGVLVSRLPQYRDTIVRVLTGPVMGAAFAQYILEIAPGGGTPVAFSEDGIQHFFYVLTGEARIAVSGGAAQPMTVGGFAYLPPATAFTLRNESAETIRVLALAFLILVGAVLIADGFEYHVPRGYVYFAMGFSIAVEWINLSVRKRAQPR